MFERVEVVVTERVGMAGVGTTHTSPSWSEGWRWRVLREMSVVRGWRSVRCWRTVLRCGGKVVRSGRVRRRTTVGGRTRSDGVSVSAGRTVTSHVEVVVRREVVSWGAVRPDWRCSPWPGVGVSPAGGGWLRPSQRSVIPVLGIAPEPRPAPRP